MVDASWFETGSSFADRHIGPRSRDVQEMLGALGYADLDALVGDAVPRSIRAREPLRLPPARTEHEILRDLQELAARNAVFRSYLGLGYHACVTPPVIQRNVLENPCWYTQYTAYQAEISQGRLEALLNFQTVVSDLTGLPVSNASLLDEATAAAEAMALCHRLRDPKDPAEVFFVSEECHPQTIEVVKTRALPLGFEVVVGAEDGYTFERPTFGMLVQYPSTSGEVKDHAGLCRRAHEAGALVVVACDLLALTLLRPPGEFGADVAVGNSQRFGVPLGYGGPHAAFLSARSEYQRKLPGRIVGVSRDSAGRPALRLALQTREQHIRRDRATSNICTAQVLLAVMASMYAVYHGPEGLRRIARRVHRAARLLERALVSAGHRSHHATFFDTLRITPRAGSRDGILEGLRRHRINVREFPDGDLGIALDETVEATDLQDLVAAFGGKAELLPQLAASVPGEDPPPPHRRTSEFLTSPVFHRFHTETELLRYATRLQGRDLSLANSMIPLGSCTMKLNATAEMVAVTWPGFADLHPFAPVEQAQGYHELFERLESWLAEITGFSAVSLQPNAGSQGEYAGLLVIRAYHAARGEGRRDVCLIPTSAHGTNPASAAMAGLRVVPVACDDEGNIELQDLAHKAEQHAARLAAVMVTYPSTHGVFEEGIRDLCQTVHRHGGQVYLDGANLNAMVGVCRPGELGADVCHLNLHKTFCIPHGGGGPGMGPIAVAAHLAPFLPSHPLVQTGGAQAIGAVSAAPWGSPLVLPISYAYIALMGAHGLTRATQVAILNANYMARRLHPHFPVLYRGRNGLVAHECIVDLRPLSRKTGVEVEDVAKRLMDYGFHAPTISFPVPGTLMIEPTESESREELDRYCDALIAIRAEIREIEEGRIDRADNPLKGAPHTLDALLAAEWNHAYSREQAAFPAPHTREGKFWPSVSRVDSVYGDRHLVCCWVPELEGTGQTPGSSL